ncbi:acetyl-CoA carboxylase biotin carboxylase subunit family protein [Streptomyces sp. UNOC14_S4]|uniref:ATP-grasp domain-containing protein n=1 Tax=Streptomyces sp. UNOC14_S4 TaxID=2872340 RepID=UPI001E2D7629|nr:ATP-grasp domain-containing protein [Streptomyces sp. UNOC14_S4]MCC3771408.1 ATP-grasp domain-containing protein [Streptomyces sp. UNOC14_S4]
MNRYAPARDTDQLPLLLVLNRFDDEFGEYHRFVPPGTHRLAYLATADALAPLDQKGAVATVVVEDMEYETLLPAARRIVAEHGPLAGIIGLSEFDLVTTARLREALDAPGPRTEYVLRFRDKARMKRWIHLAGVRAPRYRTLEGGALAEELVAELGLPLILKPKDGASAKGVLLVRTEPELAEALQDLDTERYEAEEYVEGAIHHIDGIRRDGHLHFATVSAYVNTCLDFTRGLPLGSVLLDPGPRRDALLAFTADCLDALELWDGPFHLEVIVNSAGEHVFLEVGLRPGGAGVPFVHRDIFHIDLYGEAVRAALGLPPLTPPEELVRPGPGVGAGWLVLPEPTPWPQRVVARNSLVEAVPECYAEALPHPGQVFTGDGGYDHAGGRFLFRGPDEATVRAAVLAGIARYRLETTAADAPSDASVSAAPASAVTADAAGAR